MMKILCIGALSIASFYHTQNFPVSAIPENLKKNASVIIRKENNTVEINKINDITYKKLSVITVLNKDAIPYSLPRIAYEKGNSISNVKVIVYDEKGNKIKSYSKSDFTDIAANPQGTFYSDNRMLILPFTASSFPYTVEFSYELNDENTVFIPDFIPFYEYNISLEESNFNIINKSGINLRSKVYESPFNYTSVAITSNGENRAYSYKNVPAIDNGQLVPAPQKVLPKVSFSLDRFNLKGKQGSIASWKDFGTWYYQNLLTPVSVSTPQIKAEIASLNLSGTTEEKVKTIYQYMQNKTRYIFVALGIGGWQPMFPDEVQKKGYGDCKGLTNYMKTLLDEAGIKSFYCIINSNSSEVSFDKDFPKMAGNHVILTVPTDKENIWLENTSQQIAFNHLSFNTTDRNVLMVKSDGIDIIQTPSSTAEDNNEKQTLYVQLNSDRSITGKGNFIYHGAQYDYNLMHLLIPEKDKTELLKKVYSTLDFENIEVKDFNNNKNSAAITFDLNFKALNYSKSIGNGYVFRAVPIYKESTHFEDSIRDLPFESKLAYKDESEIIYELPQGYFIEEIPKSINIDCEFGSYNIAFEKHENKLIVKRMIKMNKGVYPKEKFSDFINFKKRILNSDNSKILMSKKA
ncbi:DUF3857 domain-containing protein [Chryseobacterium hagamense]|uniref:DUF3857 domain-containing protein n=1 Tax=Chryseobacterium hagamense TaxID=395935 RepID=A0A511YNL1_9FLAO|nr:DUF3857 domain-containing protein [Chryseobacterium hagamense]GEN76782.1 hypothetical protein CHA01nite_25220 [Chryseobacterium hagamense]